MQEQIDVLKSVPTLGALTHAAAVAGTGAATMVVHAPVWLPLSAWCLNEKKIILLQILMNVHLVLTGAPRIATTLQDLTPAAVEPGTGPATMA